MVPDFYAILGVDPRADRAAIESALVRSQPVWSSGTRNPKTKHAFQSYLDQIPALRQALLADPTARAAYDAERDAQHQADRAGRLDALHQRVRLRAAKGGLTVGDIIVLREEATRLGLTQADLDRLTAAIPPKPEAPADSADEPDAPVESLDPVMRRQIKVALDHLRKPDLYAALGLDRDAPASEVVARAEDERRRWMKKTQVTAEKTAWLEVVTLAQSHLSTPPSRARYDRSLELETEDRFDDLLKFTLKGTAALDPGTRAVLRDEADALGLPPDRADRLILRACRSLGVLPDGGSSGPALTARRLVRCRSCGGLTGLSSDPVANGPFACRNCGASLQWSCPVDKSVRFLDQPRCDCGFRLAYREPFLRYFEAAQEAFRLRDYGSSLAHLRRAQDFAPNHVGTRKGVEMVRERLEVVEKARAACEIDRAARRMVAARAAAQEWGKLVDTSSADWQTVWTEIVRGLREASLLAARARARERTDPGGARELYRRALTHAVDLPDAIEGLQNCPPETPTDLSAEYVDGRVKLRWTPPASDGLGPVSYVILRKAEAALKHPADGVRIAETDRPEYHDTAVSAGGSVAYAVLSKRGDVESVNAVAAGPIFLIGEVRGLRADVRSREISLSWTPPGGAADARVVRKLGSAPTGPLDGDRVDCMIDQAHDSGLDPDRVYHYGVFAIYRTPEGRSTASRGVFLAAQPHTPVAPPAAPSVSLEADGRLLLRWSEPSRGLVKILRTAGPFPHAPGSRLSPAEVAALEGDWLEVEAPDEAHDLPSPWPVCHYTPLSSWGGVVTVGRSTTYTTVADPSDLRVTRLGEGRVALRWRWAEGSDRCVVVLRSGTPPAGPADPLSRTEPVSRDDYDRLDQYTLNLPFNGSSGGPWHVAVYSQAEVEGRGVASPGAEPSARTILLGVGAGVTVAYHFRRARLTSRRWSVTLRTEPAGAAIPATVLVANPRAVPFSPDDGTVVGRFPAAKDGATFPVTPGVNLARQRARLFADPESDPDSATPILLRHPEADATRV